jgi:DNA invertase Pin-like site-specific DNA recombinase
MTVAAVCCCTKIKKAGLPDGNRPVTWVELVRRYSNRADLLERLTEARSRARLRGGEDPDNHQITVSGRTSGVWRVRDRLTDDDVRVLIADFLAGTSKRELAGRYDVSFSTVKNILRKHGVRRTP